MATRIMAPYSTILALAEGVFTAWFFIGLGRMCGTAKLRIENQIIGHYVSNCNKAVDLPILSTATARANRFTPPAQLRNIASARIFTGKLLVEL